MAFDNYSYNPTTGDILNKKGRPVGSFTKKYGRICIKGKMYSLARLGYYLKLGEWPDGELDHINGNPHDNRWENLRLCSRSDNAKNRRIYTNNSVGYKGVYPLKYKGRIVKYGAKIQNEGVAKYLGSFVTPEEAAEAYNKECLKLHGNFADLNIIKRK